jgi:LuxR family quorum-sensing system transcriptional regulator SolR
MNKWQTELFDVLREMRGEQQIADRIGRTATELGFDHFSYGVWLPLPLSSPAMEWVSNTPPEWQQRYRQMRHAQRDPVALHARRSREPLVWTDTLLAREPALQADARRHGLCVGWAQASINAQGMRGMLSLTRQGPSLGPAELLHKETDLRWLAYMAHLFLSGLVATRRSPQAPIELTDREAEVLRWTGDGKTTGEISSILEISDNTVNYHLKNAMAKLQAANKTSAVVMALTQGLLAY